MAARQAWVATLFFMVMTLLAQVSAAQERHVAITLVPETARPAAGSTVTLAFDSRPAPEWHGYWRNPGDAGIETQLQWTLPQGVNAGKLRYPVPERLIVGGLMNYVYEAPFAQLVDLTIPAGLAPGTKLSVSVKADYLVCTREICVPETTGGGRSCPSRWALPRHGRWRTANSGSRCRSRRAPPRPMTFIFIRFPAGRRIMPRRRR